MPMSTRELFARLIKCEAGGEGDNGMKAVATVIMNRVHASYGEYMRLNQGDLRKVILQPYQFTCCMERAFGEVNPQTVWAASPDRKHYDIADWALSGNKLTGIGECLWYYNPFSAGCSGVFPRNGSGRFISRVNLHCFYVPTPKYALT